MTDYILAQTSTQIQSALTKVLDVPGSKLGSEYYRDVLAYGLIGNGTTDNSAAMQALVNSLTNGGKIYFPPGEYLMNNISITNQGIYIDGAGAALTFIINNSTNHPVFTFGDGTMKYSYGIKNIWIAQKAGVTATTGNCAIFFNVVEHVWIEDVVVQAYPAALYNGIVINGCLGLNFSGTQVNNCLHNGIDMTNGCVNIFFTNCFSSGNANDGWHLIDVSGLYLANIDCYYNGNYGFYFNAGGLGYNNNAFIVNCSSDTSGNDNWCINNATRFKLVNCWSSFMRSQTVNTGAMGFNLNTVTDTDLISCEGILSNHSGIYLASCSYINILGGNFNSNNQSNVSGVGIFAASGSFINIQGAKIRDWQATQTQAYGLNIAAGVTNSNFSNLLINTNTPVVNNGGAGVILKDIQGWKTEGVGRATIRSGQSSIAVTHGLAATPTKINVTGSTADTNALYVDTVGTTTFTVHSSGNVGANRFVYWKADV